MEEVGDKKKILADLGRPTKRGIKKCFKCGIYNGTRGFTCKNKECDAILRDVEKRKINLDAVKLAGTPKQVYSVRVRDKGPDYRGFVQLPMSHSKHDGEEASGSGLKDTITEVSICFVDSCQRLFDDSILKCHENEQDQNCSASVCMHIESALRSAHIATPLRLKGDVLKLMEISEDAKQKLWGLVKETEGVVVQRVSKSVMVVKCQVNPKFPLGYLHLAFFMSKGKDNFDKFVCGCSEHKAQIQNREENCCDNKCLHYYACIASFASDDKYYEEFKVFINADCRLDATSEEIQTNGILELQNLQAASLGRTESMEEGEDSSSSHGLPSLGCDITMDQLRIPSSRITLDFNILNQYINALVSLSKTNVNTDGKSCTVVKPKARKGKRGYQDEDVISFTDWLSSITECINETIHYSSSENPDPLVFHIPLRFFELLRERLSSSSSKMRLPNSTEKYIRRNKPVLGNLYKYTWHITSILHVKQMFDTPEVSVDLIKHYIKNKDGEFIECSDVDLKDQLLQSTVRPPFHITFMKVGIMSKVQKDPTPFVIEWIPNFLRISNFGELKLIFQIGHQSNYYR